jgi:hypothetical protein
MRWTFLVAALLAVSAAGCSDDDDNGDASVPSAASNPSPTASASAASYVTQVNALCEAMVDKVMAVRGDKDGDGGGDFPSMEDYAAQEERLAPIIEEFDAKVATIPVTDADRAAAEAFDAYRDFLDADAQKTLAAANAGDQATYDEDLAPSAEFEAKRAPVSAAGIDCPAR